MEILLTVGLRAALLVGALPCCEVPSTSIRRSSRFSAASCSFFSLMLLQSLSATVLVSRPVFWIGSVPVCVDSLRVALSGLHPLTPPAQREAVTAIRSFNPQHDRGVMSQSLNFASKKATATFDAAAARVFDLKYRKFIALDSRNV